MLIALALQAALSAAPAATPVGPPPSADPFGDRAFAHVSRAPVLSAIRESVDIATATEAGPTAPIGYILRLTRRQASRPDTVLWADSRACPAVRPMLVAMRAVALPHPWVPGIDAPGSMVVDGTEYRLQTEAKFAHGRPAWVDFGANVGTPLADWVERSFRTLASCWSPRPPRGPDDRVFLTP